MKKLSGGLLLAATTMIFISCGNNNSSTSSTTDTTAVHSEAQPPSVAADTSTNTANTPAMTDGPTFVSKAASGGMMEVELGKIAQTNASSKDVKDLAKMIMDDHIKANDELKKIASSKNITVPAAMASEEQSNLDKMKTMKGKDFDKAYVDMMVDDHNKDIDMFRQASGTLSDADLKKFATKTLPVLQKHLDKTKAVQGKM